MTVPLPVATSRSPLDPATAMLIAACCGGFLFQVDLTALSAVLADISADLRNDAIEPAWLIDIYSLALIFALPASGTLADRYGRRLIFCGGAALFGLASILCALAPSFAVLLMARILQGVSGALFTSASSALLTRVYHGPARTRAFGILGTAIGASMVVGPPLGSFLSATIGWRWIFWINVPICAAIVIVAWTRVSESSDPQAAGRRIDWAGCATLAIAVGLTAYLLLQARDFENWRSPVLVAALAAVSLVAFLVVERRHDYPAIDLRLFRSRRFVAMCLAPVATSIGYWSLLVHVPALARGPMRLEQAAAAWLLVCLTLPMLLLPSLGARLASRYSARLFFPAGLAIIGVADLGLGLATTFETLEWSAWPAVACLLLGGAGSAVINAQMTAAAIGAAPGERAAMASAICVTMRQLGFGLGIALLAALISLGEGAQFPLAFSGAGAATLAVALACFRLLR